MDNLEQLKCNFIAINEEDYGKSTACSFSNGTAHIVTNNNNLCVYEDILNCSNRVQVFQVTWDAAIKYVRYMTMYDIYFLATDYHLLSFEPVSRKINVCLQMETPILDLCWNKMETAVVLINSNNQLFLYTFSGTAFSVKYTTDLNIDVPVPVLVGWGSKNTQFRGPKQRDDKKHQQVEQLIFDSPAKISWRGNDEQFVINYFKDGKRFIKVFDSDLNPLNQSEEYSNLGQPVSFRGVGQSIACCAVHKNFNEIVIFEKNCKMKSTFEVPDCRGYIKKLLYHPRINILSVYSLDEEYNGYINIYICTNAKWYLKQQLFYPPCRQVRDYEWVDLNDNSDTTCKLIIFTAQNIEYYTFRFIINRSPVSAITAVVNGQNIQYYKFDVNNIPPPMCLYTAKHIRPINRILFHPKKLLCVLIDSKLQVIVHKLSPLEAERMEVSDELDLTNIASFYSIKWGIDGEINVDIAYKCKKGVPINKTAGSLTVQTRTFEMLPSEFLFPYNDTSSLQSYKIVNEESSVIYLTRKVISTCNFEMEFDLALTCNRELFANGKLICNGVTSLLVFENYFIFTHSNCKLYCIDLTDYNLLYNSLNLTEIFSREVEQGARIVSYNNTLTPQIILQLPRGNLETIRCRLMTINVIEKMLSENNWDVALRVIRTEKVNWNVLIDLNPARFEAHIEDFVHAAHSCAILNQIVTDFKTSENCFLTCYKNCISTSFQIHHCDKRAIIDSILHFLINTDCLANLSTIVAIQQKHISIRSALKSIFDVFVAKPEQNKLACSKALNLLLIQEHYKNVLDVVYNLYNLEFLALVFRNSTDDPKVYEPELAKMRTLQPIKLRFRMSIKGNNFVNAVKYLVRFEDVSESELVQFIKKYKLEYAAYRTLCEYRPHFKLVSMLYAEKLSLQHKYVEAGFILKKANLLENALDEYKKGLEWREVVSLTSILELDENKTKQIITELSEGLSQVNRIDEAVNLLEHCNKDWKKAISILVNHNEFRKAISLAKTYNIDNKEKDTLVDNAKSYMLMLIDRINSYESKFESYSSRLKTVRMEKKLKLDQTSLGVDDPNDELFSETGSTISSPSSSRATTKSRQSTVSSKNQRKKEKRKMDLREGGYYEDIALIRAIYNIIVEVFNLSDDVKECCLITEQEISDVAQNLHEKLNKLQNKIRNKISEIWPDEFVHVPEIVDNATLALVQNKEALDAKYCVPPSKDILDKNWKLDFF